MLKTASAPWKAAANSSAWSILPATSSAPWAARARAAGLSGSRVSARTRQPSASMRRATAPPWLPVAPVTAMVLLFADTITSPHTESPTSSHLIVLSTPRIVRSSATPPATRFAYFRGLPPHPPLPPHENRVIGLRPIERPLMSKHLSDQQAALAGHRLATTGHRDFPGDQATRGPVLAAEPGAGHPALPKGRGSGKGISCVRFGLSCPVHPKVIFTRDRVVLPFVPSFHSVQPCEVL